MQIGFSAGHDWSETWEEYLFGELAHECSATLTVLSLLRRSAECCIDVFQRSGGG